MKATINGRTIELVRGDITTETTVAIANAANTALAGGGGVDGAIHLAAGPTVMEELKRKYPGGTRTGTAVITGGGNLKAKWILHAVGPKYSGASGDPALLLGAYMSCLTLCMKHGIPSIAFPSISTGVYGYPLEKAAPVALGTVAQHMMKSKVPSVVRFVLFDDETFEAYHHAMHDLNFDHGH